MMMINNQIIMRMMISIEVMIEIIINLTSLKIKMSNKAEDSMVSTAINNKENKIIIKILK
jgi:hypothetical protein